MVTVSRCGSWYQASCQTRAQDWSQKFQSRSEYRAQSYQKKSEIFVSINYFEPGSLDRNWKKKHRTKYVTPWICVATLQPVGCFCYRSRFFPFPVLFIWKFKYLYLAKFRQIFFVKILLKKNPFLQPIFRLFVKARLLIYAFKQLFHL